jgi:hypothetical protein
VIGAGCVSKNPSQRTEPTVTEHVPPLTLVELIFFTVLYAAARQVADCPNGGAFAVQSGPDDF